MRRCEVFIGGRKGYDALEMKLPFTKMHGLGNDFVILDGREHPDRPWASWAPQILDRRFGVGADQLLVLLPSEKADVFMATYERDGRESEMCGNGARCVGRYVFEHIESKKDLVIDTRGGLKKIQVHSLDQIEVNMGEPLFEVVEQIPLGEFQKEFGEEVLTVYPVSMGNPHAVIFVKNEQELAKVQTLGPVVEGDPVFPQKANVEFVYPVSSSRMQVRVWERGAGETLACGTGACAVAVAAIRKEVGSSPIEISFPGGSLFLEWAPGESVRMKGPATEVFRGEVEL